jgi:glutamyl-Q tRNA(Asp) synthetase
MADYEDALRRLQDMGLLYRCFRTRKEVLDEIARAPHGPEPEPFRGGPLPWAEEEERLARGEPFAWRLSLEAVHRRLGGSYDMMMFLDASGPDDFEMVQAEPETAGDVVLARKGMGVAYHLAVVVDDAAQGITQVVRGEDLFEAVPVQRLLQALLGLPTPDYRHHRLLFGPDGKRLAKRDKAETLAAIRERGVSAASLRADLGFD